jgi:hypothetical protein
MPGNMMLMADALGVPLDGQELARRIAAAQAHPLGSRENPVRVSMPTGQREYLSRLRCSDGTAPSFARVRNYGVGVFGAIIDGYDIVCASGDPARRIIYMDMYHPQHDETAAPPGYDLAPRSLWRPQPGL